MSVRYLTVSQFAETIQVSPRTIQDWIAHRRIEFVKIGPRPDGPRKRDTRAVRIPSTELSKLIETRKAKVAA